MIRDGYIELVAVIIFSDRSANTSTRKSPARVVVPFTRKLPKPSPESIQGPSSVAHFGCYVVVVVGCNPLRAFSMRDNCIDRTTPHFSVLTTGLSQSVSTRANFINNRRDTTSCALESIATCTTRSSGLVVGRPQASSPWARSPRTKTNRRSVLHNKVHVYFVCFCCLCTHRGRPFVVGLAAYMAKSWAVISL